MIKPMKKLLLGLLFLLPFFGIAQKTQLQLLDEISNEPIAFANVLVTSLNSNQVAGYTSNEKGIVSFNINQNSLISISYIGYRPVTDTVGPGDEKIILIGSVSYNIDEVVVTGQYFASRQDKSIYKVKVLSSLEIDQKAAVNIKDMLSTELNIRTSHSILGSSMTMQGLGGEHIKFLVDGVPVIGREAGNIDLDQINLQNIDHIEVINGPMSVVYGSNALAGVINIITKSPDRSLFSSYLTTYYESVGVYNISAGITKSIKQNSFGIAVGRNFFNGYNPVDQGRFQQWKPKEQWNASADYKYKWKTAYIKFAASFFNQKLIDKGSLLPPNHEIAFDKYFFTRRLVVRSDFNYEFSEKARINATASFSKYSKMKNTYQNDLTILEKKLVTSQQDTTLFDNIMLRSDYSYGDESSLIRFQVGIDLNNEKGSGKRIRDNEQNIGSYAAFVSMNYSPIRIINIQPGLRFIYNTKYKAPLIYSFNVKYDVSEYFIVRASVASGFRAPSLKELYLVFVDANHDIHGNENLKAETSINTNIMLQYNSHFNKTYVWGFELNLFNNNIKDNIQLLPHVGGGPLLYYYVNVDRFISRGVELGFNNKIYPWLTIKFGMAYIGKKLNSSSFVYYSDYNASVTYWLKPLDINLSVYYKYNAEYPNFFLDDGDVVLRKMEAYQTLDININKWFFKRRINLQLGGKNLFDVNNIDISGKEVGGVQSGASGDVMAINWGRSFFIKLQFKFNK